MREGRSLQELAAELERQAQSKKDFRAHTELLSVKTEQSVTQMKVGEKGEFPVTPHAHGQLAAQLEVPKKHYDRIRESFPVLYDNTVNTLLAAEDKTRLIRTLDGRVRANLSDVYKVMDNSIAASIVFRGLSDYTDVVVKSCEVTDRHLYIKVITPKVNFEVEGYGKVCGGMIFRNSEIGLGPLSAEFLIENEWCANGATRPDGRFRKAHLGGRLDAGEDGITEFLADDTKEATEKAFWLQFRDFVKEMFNPENFATFIEKMKNGREEPVNVTPRKAVEELQDTFKLTEAEGDSILTHLIQGGELNRFGVMNAITRASQDVTDYDRATEFERIGGQVAYLSKSQWAAIAG